MAKKSRMKAPANLLTRISEAGTPTKAAALGARKAPAQRKGRR